MKVTISKHQRSWWWGYERYKDGRSNWINIWWGHPRIHKWWARSVYIFFE